MRKRSIPSTRWVTCLSAAFVLFIAQVEADSSTNPDAETIKQLNRDVVWALLVEQDTQPLEEIALDSFVVVAPGGRVENKSQAVAGVTSLDVSSIELSDEQVVFHEDTAVLVGKLEADGTMQPLGKLPPMKYMAVFVKADGDWRLLSRAMTPCAPVAIKHGVC